MGHFTYAEDIDKSSLKQGDVLKKTSELAAVINEVHPYFNSTNYQYFLVLTQSCDLVIRSGHICKSKYITIAAIRSLEEALKRQAEDVYSHKLERLTKKIIDEKNNSKLTDFLVRLLNNNVPEYFYLHSDLVLGFEDPSVAFLRVSISLKSDLHFNTCLNCKILELKENFQAKLGWLVGNLYSRVGTSDWVPDNIDDGDFKKLIQKQLQANFKVLPNLPEIETELSKSFTDAQLSALTIDELLRVIKKIKIKSRKEKIIPRLEELLVQSGAFPAGFNMNRLMERIKQDPTLNSYFQ